MAFASCSATRHYATCDIIKGQWRGGISRNTSSTSTAELRVLIDVYRRPFCCRLTDPWQDLKAASGGNKAEFPLGQPAGDKRTRAERQAGGRAHKRLQSRHF